MKKIIYSLIALMVFSLALVSSAQGTITVTATDSIYTADIQFSSDEFSLNAKSVANIAYAGANGSTFVFNNDVATNALGSIFGGRIENKTLTTAFKFSQRDGRKMKTFNYTFTGSKTE